jgi:hypothetical protein
VEKNIMKISFSLDYKRAQQGKSHSVSSGRPVNIKWEEDCRKQKWLKWSLLLLETDWLRYVAYFDNFDFAFDECGVKMSLLDCSDGTIRIGIFQSLCI